MMSHEALPHDWKRIHGWDFWADYHAGRWEPATHAVLRRYIRPGSTYLDIGSWIGPTVKWAAPLASRVIAIEPDPVAFELLTANTEQLANVERVAGAVADRTGQILLRAYSSGGYGAGMSRVHSPGLTGGPWAPTGIYVSCWTLPDLWTDLAIENCSLVKMDIEGGESEVLDVIAPFLAEKRIPFLCSLHSLWWSRPLDQSWFDGFAEVHVRRTWRNWDDQYPILALP